MATTPTSMVSSVTPRKLAVSSTGSSVGSAASSPSSSLSVSPSDSAVPGSESADSSSAVVWSGSASLVSVLPSSPEHPAATRAASARARSRRRNRFIGGLRCSMCRGFGSRGGSRARGCVAPRAAARAAAAPRCPQLVWRSRSSRVSALLLSSSIESSGSNVAVSWRRSRPAMDAWPFRIRGDVCMLASAARRTGAISSNSSARWEMSWSMRWASVPRHLRGEVGCHQRALVLSERLCDRLVVVEGGGRSSARSSRPATRCRRWSG